MIKVTYRKTFTLSYGSRGLEFTMIGKARYATRSRKLADYIFTHTQEAERVNRKWGRAINLQSPPYMTSSSKAESPKGFITSLKQHHQLESNVHIHELMGSFPIQATTLSTSFSITH